MPVSYGELPCLILQAIRELKEENDTLRGQVENQKIRNGRDVPVLFLLGERGFFQCPESLIRRKFPSPSYAKAPEGRPSLALASWGQAVQGSDEIIGFREQKLGRMQ